MKKTLLLIDGSSYLYRAFHALPDLRNAEGHPTGAMQGVISMLRRIREEYQADYLACIFDAKGKTFRDDIYADYKANRPPMPQELACQIEPLRQIIEAMGWPLLCIPGVEADDVIGTLARLASERGIYTIVSTGDKDLAQLVNEQVELVNTMNNDRQDIQGVIERYGVRPEQIVDYLMLKGDTSDNIPGVPRVGDKTAARWLQKYGSLDNIIAHADEIKGVVGQNLRDFIPNFELTRQLVTVKTDCDLSVINNDPERLIPLEQNTDLLIELFHEFGFRTFLRELTQDPTIEPEGGRRQEKRAVQSTAESKQGAAEEQIIHPHSIEYRTLTTPHAFLEWLPKLHEAEIVALDTEATSLDPMQARLVGLSLSVQAGQAVYVPVAHTGPDVLDEGQLEKEWVLEQLRPWLEDEQAAKVLHNAKYDTHVLANEGIKLRGITDDTMLQAYVLEAHQRVSMDQVAQRWLSQSGKTYEDICGKGAKQIGFDQVPIQEASFYACEDADFTFRLHQLMRPQIQSEPGLEHIYRLEVALSEVLTIVERNGVAIDSDKLQEQSERQGKRLLELEGQAFDIAGQQFNLNSPKQVGEILFDKLGLPVQTRTRTGAPSTNEEVLTRLSHEYPLPKLLLEYRGVAKLKSTYTDKLPKMINADTGRLHTRYAQAAVITGRLSSSEPNLQNIPVRTTEGRQVREAFVSSLGRVVAADYSQIELRIMAHVSGDKNLQQVFHDGGDVHRATAAEIFSVPLEEVTGEQRYAAKAINFGLIYGMGEFGLANNLGITREAAKAYIDRYFMRYPGVADYMERIKATARQQGYVETVFGRRLYFPEFKTGRGARVAAAERAAINAPMQGTAADLIKMAMVKVQHWLIENGMRSLMVMQVHDELVFDAAEDEVETLVQHLPELMCGIATLDVPLIAEVGVGDNWANAH